jgi:hypothetical protein
MAKLLAEVEAGEALNFLSSRKDVRQPELRDPYIRSRSYVFVA